MFVCRKNIVITIIILIFLILTFFIYEKSNQSLLQNNSEIDYIKIIKSERKLITYSKDRPLKQYKVALGKNPTKQKQKEGDGRTPEGVYEIVAKNPK